MCVRETRNSAMVSNKNKGGYLDIPILKMTIERILLVDFRNKY